MISSILVLAFAAGAAHSALVPTAPGPGQSFNEGADCTLSWNLDTTGKWTSFNVDLMSGSNLAMQTVTNVFKGRDGTKGDTTFTWKCPQVTPHSAIYFYQFTQSGADTTWTTRFAIASPSGEVTPPANSAQPGGAAIPWGVGHLAGAGASSSNVTTVAPTTGSNTTALTTPSTAANSTNATTPATAGASNSTAASNNTTTMTGPPKQSMAAPSSTSSASSSANMGPTTSNIASASKSNTTAPSSDAASLATSKSAMATLAAITLMVVA